MDSDDATEPAAPANLRPKRRLQPHGSPPPQQDKEAFRAALKEADFKSVRGVFEFNRNQFPISWSECEM